MSYINLIQSEQPDHVSVDASSFVITDIAIDPNSASMAEASVIAVATDGTSAVWNVRGLIKRVGNGNVQIVAGQNIFHASDVGASSWSVSFSAVGTNLQITIQGDATHTINWFFAVEGHGEHAS